MANPERRRKGADRNLDPIITDPKSYLESPHDKLEIGRLDMPPTEELLRFLPTLKYEVGLVFVGNIWYIIKAGEYMVPSWVMPNYSRVLLHSHTNLEADIDDSDPVPSIGDLRNCSPTATNLIASKQALTQYGPISDGARRELDIEASTRFAGRFDERETFPQYLKFLDEIGVTFEVNSWNEMTPQKFNQLMKIS